MEAQGFLRTLRLSECFNRLSFLPVDSCWTRCSSKGSALELEWPCHYQCFSMDMTVGAWFARFGLSGLLPPK